MYNQISGTGKVACCDFLAADATFSEYTASYYSCAASGCEAAELLALGVVLFDVLLRGPFRLGTIWSRAAGAIFAGKSA